MDIAVDHTPYSSRHSIHLRTCSEAIIKSVIRPAVDDAFRHKRNLDVHDIFIAIWKYFSACFIITSVQTFLWFGWWNALTMYLWPWPEYLLMRDLVYISLGILLIFVSNKYFSLDQIREEMLEDWKYGVPKTFSWGRKFRNFGKKFLNFAAFVTTWVGAWSIFDEYIYEPTLIRDSAYIILPLLMALVVEEFLSTESIFYFIAKFRENSEDDVWFPPDGGYSDNQLSILERAKSFNQANSISVMHFAPPAGVERDRTKSLTENCPLVQGDVTRSLAERERVKSFSERERVKSFSERERVKSFSDRERAKSFSRDHHG